MDREKAEKISYFLKQHLKDLGIIVFSLQDDSVKKYEKYCFKYRYLPSYEMCYINRKLFQSLDIWQDVAFCNFSLASFYLHLYSNVSKKKSNYFIVKFLTPSVLKMGLTTLAVLCKLQLIPFWKNSPKVLFHSFNQLFINAFSFQIRTRIAKHNQHFFTATDPVTTFQHTIRQTY